MKYEITGQAKNRITGEPMGKSRTEIIDTETNNIFKGCQDYISVKQAFECFWNDLNPNSSEIVSCIEIKSL